MGVRTSVITQKIIAKIISTQKFDMWSYDFYILSSLYPGQYWVGAPGQTCTLYIQILQLVIASSLVTPDCLMESCYSCLGVRFPPFFGPGLAT